MKHLIEEILNGYVQAKMEPFAGHKMGDYFRNRIPQFFYEQGIVTAENYLVKGSTGKGGWAVIPWICIFNKKVTTSAEKGVYIVYLLSSDAQTIYLTLNQGCTDIRSSNSKAETIF